MDQDFPSINSVPVRWLMDELENPPGNEPEQTSIEPTKEQQQSSPINNTGDSGRAAAQQPHAQSQNQQEVGAAAVAKAAKVAEKKDDSSNPSATSNPARFESIDEFNANHLSHRFLCLKRSKEQYIYSNRYQISFVWHEELTVTLPKLLDPPRSHKTESKKDMEMKYPLSQWLKSNPKHGRNLIDFNGVIQSESRRETLEKRWREEALEKSMKKGIRRGPMVQGMNEKEYGQPTKKEQERESIVAHVRASCLDSSKHQQLQKYMNSMQKESDDILEINMAEKPNWQSSVDKKKWRVIGLINPDAHLSTLDHSVNLRDIQRRSSKSIGGMDSALMQRPIPPPGIGLMPMPGMGPNSMPGMGPMAMPRMDQTYIPGIGQVRIQRKDPKSMPEMGLENFDFVNYHQWIPTVFKASSYPAFSPLSLIHHAAQ